MNVELLPAKFDEQPTLANLLELYAHDFSEFHDLDLNPDGRFGYKNLPLYWLEPNRHPFLITVNHQLAGLVFVKGGSEISGDETTWDMSEFFVIRRYRRHGIGTEIAHKVWKRFPGPWEVRVMESNLSAHHFWESAIAEFIGEQTPSVRVEKAGRYWQLFSFNSAYPGK